MSTPMIKINNSLLSTFCVRGLFYFVLLITASMFIRPARAQLLSQKRLAHWAAKYSVPYHYYLLALHFAKIIPLYKPFYLNNSLHVTQSRWSNNRRYAYTLLDEQFIAFAFKTRCNSHSFFHLVDNLHTVAGSILSWLNSQTPTVTTLAKDCPSERR